MRNLVKAVEKTGQAGKAQRNARDVDMGLPAHIQIVDSRPARNDEDKGDYRGDEEERAKANAGDDETGNGRGKRQRNANDAAVHGEQGRRLALWRDGEQRLIDEREAQSRANGLESASNDHNRIVPGKEAEQRSCERKDESDGHELVKAYALEQLRRHGDGRRGDDREDQHHPIGLGERDVKVGCDVIERDVHERLRERCEKIAHEQDDNHRRPRRTHWRAWYARISRHLAPHSVMCITYLSRALYYRIGKVRYLLFERQYRR